MMVPKRSGAHAAEDGDEDAANVRVLVRIFGRENVSVLLSGDSKSVEGLESVLRARNLARAEDKLVLLRKNGEAVVLRDNKQQLVDGMILFLLKSGGHMIRYQVASHDTLRLIALRFRVSRRVIQFWNPGIVISGDEHRIHRKYVLIPSANVGNDCLVGLERCTAFDGTFETWTHTHSAFDSKREETNRRNLFRAARGGETNEAIAKLYLSANDDDLRKAIRHAEEDAEWERLQRRAYKERQSVRPSSLLREKHDAQVAPLVTPCDHTPHLKADGKSEWVRMNADAHFRREDARDRGEGLCSEMPMCLIA